ncbi:MAG: TetR family transcriptional regulator [Streptosporangiales bacterium]|nr:TetR family transcriptional regulator [Streptosporangiales bacterium]
MVNVRGGSRSRREEYSEATRQALVDSAVERFADRGYARTSLDEIVAAARVTKGALYHHFDGKQALFEAALRQLADAAVEALATAAAEAETAWDAALASLDIYLDQCRDPAYGRIVVQEGPVALGFPKWQEYERDHAYGFTEGVLRALMDEGFVRPLPLEATTQVVFGMLNAAALAIAHAPEAEQERVVEEMKAVFRRFLDGLRVPR